MSFNFLTLTKEDLLRIIASFLLGLILGVTFLNLWVGRHLDQLIYEKKELLTRIENQQTQLEKLEDSLAQENKKIIQKLEIKIKTKLDKHIKQELEKQTFEILNSLIGRNIDKVDGDLLAETLDERIIIIEKKSYQLNLIWFLIQPQSIASFTIEEKK